VAKKSPCRRRQGNPIIVERVTPAWSRSGWASFQNRASPVAPTQPAVVTVGALQAGTKDNVILDDALLRINIRTFDRDVRRRVLDAITRIVEAEAAASGAPKRPTVTTTEHYPLLSNDPSWTTRALGAVGRQVGTEHVHELGVPYSASEDFGSFGTEWGVPSVFWYVGGTDPDLYRKAEQVGRVAQDIPTNHSLSFVPVIHPTIETGVQAMVAAALDALGGEHV